MERSGAEKGRKEEPRMLRRRHEHYGSGCGFSFAGFKLLNPKP